MKYLFLLVLGLSGCASAPSWVEKRFEPKSGVIGYKQAMGLTEKNREAAVKEIEVFCNGPYKMLAEGTQTNYAGSYNSGHATATGYGNTAYGSSYSSSVPMYVTWIQLEFKCDERATASF